MLDEQRSDELDQAAPVGDRGVAARQLLDDEHVAERTQPGAAELGRHGQAQEAEAGHRTVELGRGALARVELAGERPEPLVGEAPDHGLDRPMPLAEHRLPPPPARVGACSPPVAPASLPARAQGSPSRMAEILVVNPNSNPEVTAGFDRALAPFRLEGGPAIRCVQLDRGPFGIESEADIAAVVPLLVERIRAEPADAYLVACYSDPDLDACRAATAAPVLGIQASAVATALARADRFGVVAILETSIPRHRRALARMGVLDRLADERALGLRVHELAAECTTWDRLLAAGRALVAEDGAGAVILGCAGMARYRTRLEAALAVPVIDPTQAAVGLALAARLAARACAGPLGEPAAVAHAHQLEAVAGAAVEVAEQPADRPPALEVEP